MELEQMIFPQHQSLLSSHSFGMIETMVPTIMLDVELYNLKQAYDVPLEACRSSPGEEKEGWSDGCLPIEFCESQIIEGEEDISSISNYKCCFCSYMGSISQLQSHTECSHPKMQETGYWCDLCRLNFENKTVFKRHRLQEHLFLCSHCNRSYKKQSLLLAHLPVHSEERSFICPTCDKAFLAQRYFLRHLERHERRRLEVKQETKEHTFKCSECGKGFTKKESLIKHKKIHSRASLKCSLCEFTCEKKVTLKMHFISHEGNRKYKCKHCDYSFKQIGHLKRHIVRFNH